MIPAPCGFLEVETEKFLANVPQLDEAELGAAPEDLDPVDVIFSAGELVFMVMNAMGFVTVHHEAVVRLPAIGIDGSTWTLMIGSIPQWCPTCGESCRLLRSGGIEYGIPATIHDESPAE